jgi:cobalt-zinc-cadmium efflux system membrane fusion protein
VADLSSVWVEVAVPVVNIGDIKVGQAVRVLSSGNHQQAEEKGQVIAIQPELDAASRSARVRIQLNNSHENWRVGEYVKANINTSQEKSVISIPLSAVIFEGEEASVFVQDGHELEPRLLKLGQKNADRVEVLSGLEVGERYATGSVFILKAEMGKSEASHEH